MHDPVVNTASDEELAVRAGHDRRAFLILYDRYLGRVSRYVAARTFSSDVEDLVSTSFVRALVSIDSYRVDRGAFDAWLFAIARNAVIDHQRQHRRIKTVDPPETPSPHPGPEGLAILAEAHLQIRAGLRRLTADQCDAILLRYIADLPYTDVGQALGRSEAAAKMLVQRGLHALHQYLQEEHNEDFERR